MSLRHLTPAETDTLERQGCRCACWDRVKVDDPFITSSYRNVTFAGDIELYPAEGMVDCGSMTFDAGIRMAGALGDTALAAKCSSAAERMRKVTPDYATTKQSAALAALAGLVPARQVNEEVLKKGGVEGFSTFYGYYMLQAKAKAGDYAGAIDNIDTYWGAMLDLGATTFWEDFDIKWLDNAARIDELVPEGKVDVHRSYGDFCYKGFRHSFCHGWASGPTAWLSEHVLGISIVEPGCKAVRVRPHLGGLQWAEGTFPTPYGVISVRHERQGDGTVKSKISAPKGVKIVR
jgi:alpha-L-rhamnosidase